MPQETIFERSFAERMKSRKERFDEIKKKEQEKTMNCVKHILLIIKVQVVCAKN